MTSKERMLAAYKKQKTDVWPVSPEIWSATVLEYKRKPFHKYLGPFTEEDYVSAWLETQKHFGFDAWLLSDLQKPQEGLNYSGKSNSRFIDEDNIETRREVRTSKGCIEWVTRTNREYEDWGFENPVKNFEKDIGAYVEYTLDDPSKYNDRKLKEDILKVGDEGLLSAHLGDLFVSYLAAGRVGDIAVTLLDLVDYEEQIKEIHSKYIDYLTAKIQRLSTVDGLDSVCITNGYSNAGIIGPGLYEKWEVPVLKAVARKAHEHGFVVHLHQHGRCRQVLSKISETGIDLVDCLERPSANGDVDNLQEVVCRFGKSISLKGNIDPINVLKNGTKETIERQVRECLEAVENRNGFILSTGDSVVGGTPFKNLEILYEAAAEFGK
jgi:Uroporphyrinogen-III decarboxylase